MNRFRIGAMLICMAVFLHFQQDLTAGASPIAANIAAAPTAVCDTNANDVGGMLFRDYNADGVQGNGEAGFGVTSMVVTAFAADNTVEAVANVDADGTYVLPALADGNSYRLEFSGLPTYLEWSSAVGADSGSSVQFVRNGTCDANVAISNPADYCSENAMLGAPCYAFGDQIAGTFSLSDTLITVDPTWQRSDTGIVAPDTEADLAYWQPNMPNHLAFANETGAVYGVAWSDTTNHLYVSAYQKAHTGYGPGGRGQIYRVPVDPDTGLATGSPTSFVNIETDLNIVMCGTHGVDLDGAYDAAIFNEVGKCGLGDLEISDDDSTLFVTDLTNRQVVGIDIATQAIVGPWTLPASAAAKCRDAADLRPFGLGFKDGLLYVGAICSGETRGATQNWLKEDLHAMVYTLDPATGFNTTPVLDYDWSNQRHGIYDTEIQTWIDDIGDVTTGRFAMGTGQNWVLHRSQMLTDIEFVGNNMILGFRSRFADQWGVNVPYDHDGDKVSDLFTAINEGDVVCTSFDSTSGTYIWETNDHVDNLGVCGTRTASDSGNIHPNLDYSGTTPYDDPLLDDGEFYWGDGGAPSLGNARHFEISFGGLAQAGTADLAITALTPPNALGVSYDQSGGFAWLNNQNGAPEGAFVAYDRTTSGAFSKASGMGDVEALCQSAPLEVGNTVWLDTDNDGIQDADEQGIAGVTVTLTCGQVMTTTITAADNPATLNVNEAGQYYFSGAPGGNAYGILLADASCSVSIDTTQSALSNYELTIVNSDGTTANAGDSTNHRHTDVRDSDATLTDTTATVSFIAGGAGIINHTFDFGFANAAYGIGNFVWLDGDVTADGIYSPTIDTPISGVVVELWDGAPDAIGSTLITSTMTVGGAYSFDDLLAGDYYVHIPSSEFAVNEPLNSAGVPLSVSPNTGSGASDDDGDHNAVSGDSVIGISSGLITLGGVEPTGEAVHGLSAPDDNNTDWTIDFAFFVASSQTAVGLAGQFTNAGSLALWVPVLLAVMAVGSFILLKKRQW